MFFQIFSQHRILKASVFIVALLVVMQDILALAPKSQNTAVGTTGALKEDFIPAPLYFPNPQTDVVQGQGYTDRWFRDQLIVASILRALEEPSDIPPWFSFTKLQAQADALFEQYGRKKPSGQELNDFLKNKLINSSLLAYQEQVYSLKTTPRLLAVWADDVEWIGNELKQVLKKGSEPECVTLLENHAHLVSLQPLYPLEAQYPFRRAVTLLNPEEKKQLAATLSRLRKAEAYKADLINSLDLQLNPEDAKEAWLATVTPALKDARIYDLSPEFSEVAGGLGRVQQYHITGMHRLDAKITSCEPKYRWFKNLKKVKPEDPDWIPADYAQASYPVTLRGEASSIIPVSFKGKEVSVQVEEGVNNLGVPVLLLSDLPDASGQFPLGFPYCQKMYTYREGDKNPDNPENIEFAAFFAKAYWVHIREKERKIRTEFLNANQEWKPPIVNLNDGQSLLTSVFRLVDYLDAVDRGDLEEAVFLRSFLFSATTHTYKNRGFFGYDQIKDKLISFGIPENLHWLFGSSHSETNAVLPSGGVPNVTSAGLNAADVTKAVSALHAKEVLDYDPALQALYGITNGDLIDNSSQYFQKYLQELSPESDSEIYPELSADQVGKVKKMAKKNTRHQGKPLGLNPDQLTVGYSGRWVSEKCCSRGFDLVDLGNDEFTSNNIEEMLRNGIQVVIYGNVQPYDPEIGRRWHKAAEHIRFLKAQDPEQYPGQFIFKDKFTLDEQLQLLAALDLQIQDSDRSTGASEYTESNATANGALSMGSPYHEGVINKHGLPLNFFKTGWGNSIVPENEKREAYLKAFLKVTGLFEKGTLPVYQANSIRLSQILNASQTSAANLKLWNRYYDPRSPHYYKHRSLPGRSAWAPPQALFHRVVAYKEVEDSTHIFEDDFSFTQGDTVSLDIEYSAHDAPTEVNAYLQGSDGTRHFLKRPSDSTHFVPFVLPDGVVGEFQLFLQSGRTVQKFEKKIIFKARNESPFQFKRKILDNGVELTIRFENFGAFLHGTFVGTKLSAWKGILPDGVSIVGWKEGQEVTLQNTEDTPLENSLDLEMIRLPDHKREVRIFVDNRLVPPVTHFVFVTQEETGRWHNNSGLNHSVPLWPAQTAEKIPTTRSPVRQAA